MVAHQVLEQRYLLKTQDKLIIKFRFISYFNKGIDGLINALLLIVKKSNRLELKHC